MRNERRGRYLSLENATLSKSRLVLFSGVVLLPSDGVPMPRQ